MVSVKELIPGVLEKNNQLLEKVQESCTHLVSMITQVVGQIVSLL